MNVSIIIPLIMAISMVAVLGVAYGFPYLQAKLSVLFAASVVFIMAMIQLAKEISLRKEQVNEPKAGIDEQASKASRAQYIREAAWVMGLGLSIYLIGFYIAIPFYVIAYMRSHGTRWHVSIITGLLMAAFCYGIVSLVLDVRLYPGILLLRGTH